MREQVITRLEGGPMADYDDDRPNWREIDRKKDRSSHYGGAKEKGQKKEGPKDRWQEGRVKEALDRLFMGKKGTMEHDKAYRKLHSNYGTGRFLTSVQKYMSEYGLPDDAPTLLLIMDTKEEGITLTALEKLKELYPSLQPRQKEDVKHKLSILAMTDKSREVKKVAGAMLKETA
jgi:hypothetical protein